MILYSWNVNGLQAAVRKGLLDWFDSTQPDVLCLQETKKNATEAEKLVARPGYSACFVLGERKGYSGVGLITRPKPKQWLTGMGGYRFDREGRLVGADYGDLVVLSVYFPNGKASRERLEYKLAFYDAFLDFVLELHAQGKSVVFCGDVNTAHTELDLARPKENSKVSGFLPEERAWLDKVIESGFVDTFRLFTKEGGHYSWWDLKTRARERNVGWRLDYFFVSEDLVPKVKRAWIASDVMGSDHCPVGLELDWQVKE